MTSIVTSLAAASAIVAAGLSMAGAAAQDRTALRLVVPRYSTATGPVFEAAAEAFEARNPDIDVRIAVVPWDHLFQTLTADISRGDPPDIAIISTRWLADFVADGVVAPIDGHLTPEIRALFIPALLRPAQIEGQVWGLPAAASARAMYVNKALFAQAGIENPPATWAELGAAAGAISALGDDIHGFGLQGAEIETDLYFYYALWSRGGRLIEEDGTSGLDSDEAVAAAETYKRFIDEGLTQPDVTAFSREDVQDLFKAGRLGIVLTGPWLRDQLAAEAPDLDFGVERLPAGPTEATYGVTDTMVMFSGSPAQDAAWALIAFLFQPEFRRDFIVREGLLPTTVAVATSDMMGDDPALSVLVGMLPDARFTPTIANWEEIADLTSAALRRIYRGEESPRDALTGAAAKIDAMLAQ